MDISFIGLIYRISADVLKFFNRKNRKLTGAEIVNLRQKWKPQFEEALLKNDKEGLRNDVIIRDINRHDCYPNHDDGKNGISPWFRVGLVGTYHKGILIGLGYHGLKKNLDGKSWRYPIGDEKSDETFLLIGKIPFEYIENVDWHGDEYYGYPHIYCWFNSKSKEPYEQIVFCRRQLNNGYPFYTDIAKYADVKIGKKQSRRNKAA
jgi:hypothetical protein